MRIHKDQRLGCERFLTEEVVESCRRRLIRMHFDNSIGHFGGNSSCLEALLVIFWEVIAPSDELIVSKGHAAGALYVALASIEHITDSELSSFHRDGTSLPGHVSSGIHPQVRFSTGSLGHGLSIACGLALAAKQGNGEGRVICLTSDGEWQEGSSWEALNFAIHHRLTNLTILIDHNELQGFGRTDDILSMNPLWSKFEGFSVYITIIDGHSLQDLRAALKSQHHSIHMIFMKTIKGKGVSILENKLSSHYVPITRDHLS